MNRNSKGFIPHLVFMASSWWLNPNPAIATEEEAIAY